MIEHSLDTAHSVLHVRPTSALEEQDFVQLARTVDPYIEDHHTRIRKVAVVTDRALGTLAEKLASHFVSATGFRVTSFPHQSTVTIRRPTM